MSISRLFCLLICLLFAGLLNAQFFYRHSPEADRWVDSVFNSLTPQQRIAQLMVVRLTGRVNGGVVSYKDKVRTLITDYDIGSVCLFQGNPSNQANDINELQQLAETPLMFCIDGETGLGMRMTDSVIKFPDNLTLGAVSDSSVIYSIGVAIGEQCKRIGIQVNYAPVVDINNNPNNPVINFRSFGQNKYKVANDGVEIMRGIQSTGVMACAKHFPGHGDVAVDSHLDLPLIPKSLGALDTMELYPFRKMFAAGVGSVMIAHLNIPAIDSGAHTPTSLSRNNVTGLLRDSLGFNGISFTDALEMQAVAKYYPQGAAAVQSLIAGNDMLCLPGDVGESIDKIMKAVADSTLLQDSLDAKTKKVLLVKYNMGLYKTTPVNTANLNNDLNKDVPAFRKIVAENALTLLHYSKPLLFPLQPEDRIAYVGIGTDSNTLSDLLKDSLLADCYYYHYDDDTSLAASIMDTLKDYSTVIIGIHQYHKYPAGNYGISQNAVDLIKNIQAQTPAITMLFGNPYAAKSFCDASNLVMCYEDDSIFQKTAFNWLTGKFAAKGKLPVTVCDAYKYGDGITIEGMRAPIVFSAKEVGLDSAKLTKIDSLAYDAISQHATPGCVVLVAKDNRIAYYKSFGYLTYDKQQPVLLNTMYDLASVTKVSSTLMAVMKLYEGGKLDINKTLGDYLPWVQGSNKSNITLRDILLHQGGMVPFIPFYKETIDESGVPKSGFYKSYPDSLYSIPVASYMFMRNDWKDTIYQRILQSPVTTPGQKYVYSDNDFIFLQKVVEQITDSSLDVYAKQNFYDPLQMRSTMFKPFQHTSLYNIAPTEQEKTFRLQLLRGYVHDPGAAMFGGVSGHAGLFSNACDLSKLYLMLLNGGEWNGKQYFQKSTIDYFTSYQTSVSRRGLGWDKPEKDNATNGDPYPALGCSPQTFGHTGFTGICVWADPKYNLLFIFLSNRVNPEVSDKLSTLSVRRNMLQAVYDALLK